MTKTIEEVKKALELCSPDGRCQYETNPECPYRITEFICGRSQLMLDAKEVIENLHDGERQHIEMLDSILKIVCPNCEECDW